MDKDSKWYKSIQILYNVAQTYGDIPISSKTDDNITKIYYEVKEIAKDKGPFVEALLIAFVKEKERERRCKNE